MMPPAPQAPSPPAAVLVVDDDPVSLMVLTALLEQLGHHSVAVADGAAALAALRSGGVRAGSFACAILDVRLPDMEAWTLAARIAEVPGAADLPLVAMSASMPADRLARLQASGFAAILRKPINRDQLRDTLAQVTAHPAATAGPTGAATGAIILDRTLLAGHASAIGTIRLAGILDRFLAAVPGYRAEISAAGEAADLERLARIAHKLASAADTAGLPRVAALARAVEADADAGRPLALRAVAVLLCELRSGLAAVEDYRTGLDLS